MAVERDRWYGAPISTTGELREPQAGAYRRVLATLRELDWTRLRRRPTVLLVENRDESRRAAARAVGGELVPPFTQVLPLDPRLFAGSTDRSAAIAEWERGWREWFDATSVDWDEASSSSLPDPSRYRLVVVASRSTLAVDAQEALARAEADGVHVVSDETDELVVAVPDHQPRAEAEGVDVTELADGDRRVVLTVNGTDRPVHTRVVGREPFDLDLPAWGVDVREVMS
jgi:hypothetical protein